MCKMKVKVTSTDKFHNFLGSLQTDGFADELTRGALEIAAAAEKLAPVELGALSSSIVVSGSTYDDFTRKSALAENKRPGSTKGISHKVAPNNNSVWLYPAVFYAIHQEFGTIRNSAHPFLIPAITSLGKTVLPKGVKVGLNARYLSSPPIVRTWNFG